MHDRNGSVLKLGDIVMLEAEITSLNAGEDFCNVTVKSVDGRRPDGCKETVSAINTGVLTLLKKAVVTVVMLAIMLASSAGMAADPLKLLNITNVGDGSYLLTIDKGVISLTPIQILEPGVVPIPNPTPSTLTERGKLIKEAADKVIGDPNRPDTAKLLAELYRQIAAITGTQLKGDNVMVALKMATDAALRDDATKAAWKPVRDVVTEETKNLARAGAAESEYAKYFLECAAGYDASSRLLGAINPEVLKFIMQIIQLILSLLKPM